jgi:colanic acid/amylovoran biosynthesis protein
MANKGTQALISSDVSIIRSIAGDDAVISVSTTDTAGVKKLGLPLAAILPATVDIPYERADSFAKRFGYTRNSFSYKFFALCSLFLMLVQMSLSLVSIVFVKAGLKAFYRPKLLAAVKDCDVVVSCSDENFKESASMLPLNVYWVVSWWSMLIVRVWEIFVAKSFRKPIVMFPNSMGPFRTAIGRLLSRMALNNCVSVLIREPISYGVVESLMISSRKILTSDTALTLDSEGINSKFVKDSKGSIGVSPGLYAHSLAKKRVQQYILDHAKALDRAIEKHGFSVVFLPHYISGFQFDDLDMCKLIIGKMEHSDKARIIEPKDLGEFRSIVSQMDLIVSSKMHPAVLAASVHVPIVFVAYDHKQTGFAASLSLSDCLISLNEVTCARLLSKIDHVWNSKAEIKALLKARVPELQKNVRKSIESAMAPFIRKPQK